ncbi:MAG: phosphate signaling complex protein PhoU [Actinobacteria bacterium]|nr:phosphate signaling complex protein PhoU [Actinomycetota bacterium]MDI6830257.1 phosphate signaling complex protein PhoU [Actinomycetota bacterium]
MEPRKDFHQRLDELYAETLRMGADLLEAIEKTRICFATLDRGLADEIIAGDDLFDAYIDRIEEGGLELIALQAPVAVDLRMIVVIMRMAQHFERMADLCEDIAQAVKHIPSDHVSSWMREAIDEMARRALRLVERSIECFKERSVEMAGELDAMDDAVDRLHRKFFKEFDRGREEDLEVAVRVVMVARFFERIADHAVDIGEHVRFMVEGTISA